MGSAVENVGDVDVLSGQADQEEHFVQHVAGWTNKRQTGLILLPSRSLTDEEYLSVWVSRSWNGSSPCSVQGTTAAPPYLLRHHF